MEIEIDVPLEISDRLKVYFQNVVNELIIATNHNGSFNSAHEGYAVILEELDELWEQVKLKDKDRNYCDMSSECIQISAMTIRFILDCC